MRKLAKHEVQDILALTPLQEGILFHYLMNPSSDLYHEQISLSMEGVLDVARFKRAFEEVIQVHELLRVIFRWRETKNPVQIILKGSEAPDIRFFDLQSSPSPIEALEEVKRRLKRVKFDFENKTPFTVSLCQLNAKKFELVLNFHHILMDGWSTANILQSFMAIYHSQSPQKSSTGSFKDFIKFLQSQNKEHLHTFWSHYLNDLEIKKVIRRNSDCLITKTKVLDIELSQESSIVISKFLKEQRLTFASFIYGAWGLVLRQFQMKGDVVMGITVSGRNVPVKDIEGLVGLFINTVPLRVQFDKEDSLNDYLRAISNQLLDLKEYEHTSLTEIKKAAQISPKEELFESLIVIDNYPLPKDGGESKFDFLFTDYNYEEQTNYPISINAFNYDEVKIRLNYDSSIYDESLINRLQGYLLQSINLFISSPSLHLKELCLISESERTEVLKANYPAIQKSDESLASCFQRQVSLYPDRQILIYEDKYFTYDHLDRWSNQIAKILVDKGLKSECLVGLVMGRGPEMVASMLGVLKAGGAFVPVDVNLPQDRVKFILEDCGVSLVLVNKATLGSCAGFCEEIEVVDISVNDSVKISATIDSSDLAYAIYTSGSTGRPKGVLIEQASLLMNFKGMLDKIRFGSDPIFLCLTTVSFDPFFIESLLPLMNGFKVIYGSELERKNPMHAAKAITKWNVTVLQFTPSHLKAFLEDSAFRACLSGVQHILIGGELVLPDLIEELRRWYSGAIYNVYGPTETTVWATVFEIGKDNSENIHVGAPLPGKPTLLLDDWGRIQPQGVEGEIYIGGTEVARGYLNNPELTNEKFVQLSYQKGTRFYRTGDVGKWFEDGALDVVGRIDSQVKIRGYRIELGEIEHWLQNHPSVKSGVVIVKNTDQDKTLVAYVTKHAEQTCTQDDILDYLKLHLPVYMIPAFVVILDSFPLSPSGKIDRKALAQLHIESERKTSERLSTDDLHRRILSIWNEILERDNTGVHENFFDIGGNSLQCIRVVSRLNAALSTSLEVNHLFEYPTAATLAKHIRDTQKKAETSETEKTEIKEVDQSGDEIAIVGVACKFPGAQNVEEFWDVLKNGISCIHTFSDDELRKSGHIQEIDDKDFVKAKGVLKDAEAFDYTFFDYTPTEAQSLDPQIRVFHEVVWEALESAGYNPLVYKGSIGLYGGATQNILFELSELTSSSKKNFSDKWTNVLYSDKDFLCSRVSYKLNLRGPSFSTHSACSTSLLTVDLACRDLQTHRCDMAVAGGVSITYYDANGYLYSEGMVLSRDGYCRSFDEGASGYVGGNGAGVVVMKRLKDAVRDGDNILAVVKSTATNNDGNEKLGFTAPSIKGQSDVIAKALHLAKVPSETIGYIEAHGSATPMGDVIELKALTKAFRTNKSQYCGIGSVKSNIGHLDAAAGIAGLIKAVLAIKNKMIPPTLHVDKTNPNLQIESTPFYINKELRHWESKEFPRRAGVTSLGLGGTNVHVVLEEYAAKENHSSVNQVRALTISAKSAKALLHYAEDLKSHLLAKEDKLTIDEVCYTLQTSRSYFPVRFSAPVESIQDAIQVLSDFTIEQAVACPKDQIKSIVFMFCGQGNQYVEMASELYQQEPVFKQWMDKGFAQLQNLSGIDWKVIVYGANNNASEINKTKFTQPLLYLIEYAMAKLLLSWDIKPAYLIGHSFGEYAAAAISNVFSFEDGLRLVLERGRLMQDMPEGAMLSVALSEEEAKGYLSESLSLAAINTPSSCVLSGSHEAIDQCAADLEARGVHNVKLHTSHAGHSFMMDPILEPFKLIASQVEMNEPQIPIISTLKGDWAGAEIAKADYWAQHIRSTVRLSDSLDKVLVREEVLFLEVGPGKSLSSFVKNHSARKSHHEVFNTIRHVKDKQSDLRFLIKNIASLWMQGAEIDWIKLYQGKTPMKAVLPTYRFEKHIFPIRTLTHDFKRSESDQILDRKPANEWYYIPSWKPSPLHINKKNSNASTCTLVFTEEGGIEASLVAKLNQYTGKIISVRTGKGYQTLSSELYVIHPGKEEHYKQLFESLRESNNLPDQVVHLWNLGEDSIVTDNLEELLEKGFFSLLYLSRNIPKSNSDKIKLLVISSSMQYVAGDEGIVPEKSLLRSPALLMNHEFQHIACKTIDIKIGTQSNDKIAERLVDELQTGFTDLEIAYRGKDRLIKVFEPLSLELNSEQLTIHEEPVYVITGGLTGIGYELASSLVKEKSRLLFIGRTMLPERDQWPALSSKDIRIKNAISLTQQGAIVEYYQGDIADGGNFDRIVTSIKKKYGAVHGVVHAAGLAGGGMMEVISASQILGVLAPKVEGTKNLYEAFKNDDLQFFLLCSSLNSIAPTINQVDYSAANMYLDAFAAKAYLDGDERIMSVNWDRWIGVGMAKNAEELYLNYSGKELPGGINEKEGVDAFVQLLNHKHYQIAVSALDIKVRSQQQLLNLDNEVSIDRDITQLSASGTKARPNLSTPYEESRDSRDEKLVNIWKQYFGFDKIGIDDDFYEIGGDSLNATILLSKILKEFNCRLSLKDFLQKLTIRNIANTISETEQEKFHGIEKAPKAKYYPLSPSQKRLYFIQAFEPSLTAYNETDTFEITGNVDLVKLTSVIKAIVDRHEALRTTFHLIDGKECQLIHDNPSIQIEVIKSTSETAAINQLVRPFDLQNDLPIRVGLFSSESNKHLLIVDVHHIAADGISQGLLFKDFVNLYAGQTLKPVIIQPKDFAVWVSSDFYSEMLAKQRSYWLAKFDKGVPIIELPLDYKRTEIPRYDGGIIPFSIDAASIANVHITALRLNTTDYVVILSLYFVFLSKICDQEDVILGIPVSGRNHDALQDTIGMFVNTIPISCTIGSELTFAKLVEIIKNRTLEAIENQDYQFDDLVRDLNIKRDSSRNPLFDTAFVFHNNFTPDIEINDLTIKPLKNNKIFSKFDLVFSCYKKLDEYSFGFEYRTSLFNNTSIERFASFFEKLANKFLTDTEILLRDEKIISKEEEELIKHKFSQSVMVLPSRKTIHGLIQEQVLLSGDKAALVSQSKTLSYNELNKWADQIAGRLKKLGVTTGTIVAVFADRTVETIVAELAVLKTGAAYLPLAYSYPRKRIDYLLQDSQAACILVSSQGASQFQYLKDMMVIIDDDTTEAVEIQDSVETEINQVTTESLAFVLYTSGSTGQPKGVMIDHDHFVRWMSSPPPLGTLKNEARLLQSSSPVFDMATFEIWSTLFYGGTIYILKDEDLLNVEILEEFIDKNQINTLFLTPALFNQIIDQRPKIFKSLVTLILGGDVLSPTHVQIALNGNPNIQIYNAYGPTENSVITTGCTIHKTSVGSISIGKPLNNAIVYIIGREGQLMPIGLPGEIYVGGIGVARGYLNKPELTSEKFVKDPIGTNALAYKTGDIGRWLPDGNIEFLGRKDYQLKVRGFRIELGEIEISLEKFPSIREVAVGALKDSVGQNYLVAWYTSEERISVENIRNYMIAQLPHYMVPSYFVQVDQMPLSTNGKIERRSLPLPNLTEINEYEEPIGELEQVLEKVFCLVLNRNKVGRQENFFEIGGDSIKILMVAAKLYNEGYRLEVKDLYRYPTIISLAVYLKPIPSSKPESEKVRTRTMVNSLVLDKVKALLPSETVEEVVQLSPMQLGMLFHTIYHQDLPVYNVQFVISLKGNLNPDVASKCLKKVIARHDSLRSVFLHHDFEQPISVVLNHQNNNFKFGDISLLESKELFIQNCEIIERSKNFDLSSGPLLRMHILKSDKDEYRLIWTFHHIIMDGWCVNIIVNEFFEFYKQFSAGTYIQLPKPPQYSQYLRWLSELDYTNLRNFWTNYLSGFESLTGIPKKTKSKQTYLLEEVTLTIDHEQKAKLQSFAVRYKITVNTVLQGIWSILLSRYNNSSDVVFGIVVSGRPTELEGMDNMVGLFINTIPLRVAITDTIDFVSLVQSIQENFFTCEPYQYYPLFDIQDCSAPKQDLLDHIFIFENAPGSDLLEQADFRNLLKNLNLEITDSVNYQNTNYDLSLIVVPSSKDIQITFKFNKNVYDTEYIQNLSSHFAEIQQQVLNNSNIPVSLIDIVSENEKTTILHGFNANTLPLLPFNTIVEILAHRVALSGRNVALEFGSSQLTYTELETQSNKLARYFIRNGVKNGDVVGLRIPRSFDLIVSIYAILKSGAAFLPIDQSVPTNRFEYILKNSNASFLITDSSEHELEGITLIDISNKSYKKEKKSPVGVVVKSTDLAYIIYTSGSTGNPKGVMVEHGSVLNTLSSLAVIHPSEGTDSYLFKTPLVFDPSIVEIFNVLCWGGRVVVLGEGLEKDPYAIFEACENHRITHMFMVSSLFKAWVHILVEEQLFGKIKHLKYLLAGGEVLDPVATLRFKEANKTVTLYNAYGPTEATVFAAICDVGPWYMNATIPIGKPLHNMKLLVLSDQMKLQPIGIEGELYISGSAVARGYVNQKELTKERFLPDPFHPENFMYRTGDMAKWLPQGVLDFTGRKDSQVKLRGQRIELEEIEFTLAKYQKIKQVVVGIFGKGDDKVICAWYLAATTIDDAELISFLKNHLPSYMIPSHFIYMDAFPVTVSGKINRKELLLTGNVESKRTSHQTGDLEKALASAFGSVLNKDLVNPNISFFDLGGNSIKAIYLTSLIQKELRVKVPLAKLYEFPSVIELSTYVRGLSKEKSKEHIKSQEFKRKPFYPLSASQQRVYLSQIKDPDLTAYNMPFTMSLDEEISAEDVRNLIQKIIQRHECFRLSFQQVDGVPKQFISDSLNFSVEHINEEQLSYDEVVMNFVKPFDLTKAPLLRATIFSKGNNRKLLVDIHHIIFDGSSMQILQREFDSLVAGKNLEDIHHSYIDHIEWLNSEEYSKAVEVGEQFWLQKFGSTPKVLDLPTDYARGSNSKGIVKPIKVQLSKQITDQLKVQSGLLEVSSFHFTFAVFNLLLAKLTNQSDITVGVPVSGRSTIQMKNVVGMFVNYLPMRTKIESDVSFSEFVQNLKAQTIQSLEHQDYPYDLLVDKLNLKRVSDHNPLFDVVFNYFDNNEDNSNDDNSAEDESVSFKAGTKVDLLLFIMYRNNKHMMRFEYDPSLYKRETMEFISSSFINMIEAACLDPQQPVSSIGMRNKTRISQKDLLSTDLR